MTLKSLWRLPLIFSLVFSPLHVWAGKGEVVYDVSGKHGEDDQHGTDRSGKAGQRGDGSGADGADGGHAVENPNKNGQDAGSLFLNLSFEDGSVAVTGNRTDPGARTPKTIGDKHKLTADLKYDARAQGGRGGRGGNGGGGQDGGDGEDGRPATHIGHTPVPGGNGKNGGRGGDEGDSTSGGNAGRGGNIEIQVGIRDTDLAMLIDDVNVRGNRGGERGRSQGAGKGGAGGSGGSSDYISWSEKTGTRRVVTYEDEYNNENEKVGTKEIVTYEDVYENFSSTAPGGFAGNSGSDGNQSSRPVFNGRDAEDGKYTFTVVNENGTKTSYPGVYNLSLANDYILEGDLNKNGFFEPGETIKVKGIKVTNSGLSPTPKFQKIKLYVTDNEGWIRTKKLELTIPESLLPAESHIFTNEQLAFYLEEKPREEAGPLNAQDTIAPKARVTRVEREFRTFNNGAQQGFKIRYPVEITPLTSLESLAPGEVMKVLFKVENKSNQTIGHIEGQELRLAHAEIKRNGGSAAAEEFVMLANETAKFADTQKGLSKALSGLKPGESMIVEALVGVGANAKPYTDVTIQPELYLQSILDPKNVNRVQFNPFTLRVAQTFRHSENADVLLVSNSHLNEKALEALKYSANVKNLVMDIWDFSYYGFFNLFKSVAGYDSLFKAYANKTIIIMGNTIETPAGKQNVQSLLSPDEIIEAGRRHGIRFVILDTEGNAKDHVARLTSPESVVDPESIGLNRFSSTKQYVKELQAEVKKTDDEINGDTNQDLGYSQLDVVTYTTPWSKPEGKDMLKAGEKLLQAARAKVPEASLFIDYKFDVQHAGGWLIKKWNIGTLNVRRSVDMSRTSVLAMDIPAQNLQSADFIMSEEFQAALDVGLHLDTKLKLISAILSGKFEKTQVPAEYAHLAKRSPMDFAKMLMRSVLLEIVQEQMTIRPFAFTSAIDKQLLYNKLDILSRVADYDYGQTELDPNTEAGRLWLDFITELSYFSSDSVTTGQRVWSNTLGFVFGRSKNLEVTDVTNELIKRLIKGVFLDSMMADVELQVKDAVNKMREKHESKKGAQVAGFLSSANIMNHLVGNGTANTFESRLRNGDTQKYMQETAVVRARRNTEVQEAYAKKTAELKLPAATCAVIMGDKSKK